ncbi:MAG TPA: MFS transporter [Stellaceae bacterium]
MSAQSARLSLFFSSVGHLFSHLLMMLYPTVVLALEGRYGLTYGELLQLSLPGLVLFGAAALPAGWLGDRWSAEHMMVLFFVGMGGASILTGFATGPLGIAAGLGLVGLFGSIYHPVGLAWLVRNAENRGKALGVNGIFGSIGLGGAAFVAGGLTDLVSWRAAFIVPGVLCALTGVALLLCVRRGTVVAATVDRRPEPDASRADVVRAFLVLSVTMLGSGLIAQAMTVAMPKLFQERLTDLTDGTTFGVGGFVTLVYVITGASQVVGGWCADRFPLKWVYVVAWLVQVPLFVLTAGTGNVPLLVLVTAIQLAGICATPAENSLLARYTPAKWRATAYGAKFVLALGVSSAAVPLVGFVHDGTGSFFWLFAVLAAVATAIVAAAIFLPREASRRAAATDAVVQPAE